MSPKPLFGIAWTNESTRQMGVHCNIPGAVPCKVRMMVAPLAKKIEGVVRVLPCSDSSVFVIEVTVDCASPTDMQSIFRSLYDEIKMERRRNSTLFVELRPYEPKNDPMAQYSDVGVLSQR